MTLTVAVTGVGGAAGLISVMALRQATRWRIVGLDADSFNPGFSFCHEAYPVPPASAPGFTQQMLGLALAHGWAVILPTVDEELLPLAKAAAAFQARGVVVAVGRPATIRKCLDKYALYQELRRAGLAVAQTWLPGERTATKFPLVVKPRTGRGGQGVQVCQDQRELDVFLGRLEAPIVQEYLPGPEYSVDVLCDLSGNPMVAVPRLRVQVKGGVSWRGRIEEAPDVASLASDVAKHLGITGPACIQVKRDGKGAPKVLEVNPRIGGTTSLTVHAGVNIPHLAVKLFLGRVVKPQELRYRPARVARYFGDVFLEG